MEILTSFFKLPQKFSEMAHGIQTLLSVLHLSPSENGLPWTSLLVGTAISYTALCSALRFRRRNAMQKKFNYPDRASLSRMTNVDAQAILEDLAQLEFPFLYEISLQFALFKARPSPNSPHTFPNQIDRPMVYPQSLVFLLQLRNSPLRKVQARGIQTLVSWSKSKFLYRLPSWERKLNKSGFRHIRPSRKEQLKLLPGWTTSTVITKRPGRYLMMICFTL